MSKIVCAKCALFFHPKRNGVAFEEGMPVTLEDGAKEWRPYKLWMGDLLVCRGCGAQIIIPAQEPVAARHEEGYETIKATIEPIVFVKDC